MDPLVARVEQWLAHLQRRDAGVAVGLVVAGEIAYLSAQGSADPAGGRRVTPGTPFRLDSTSKQFTALAAALLVEDGSLDPYAPANEVLPELAGWGATTADLVHHTSGLPDYLTLTRARGDDPAGPMTAADVLRLLERQPAASAGETFRYCNSGYALLALVVERVTGCPLGEVLSRRLFVPVGMTSTRTLADPDSIAADAAVGHGLTPGRREDTASLVLGDGGIESTLEDQLRFERWWMAEQGTPLLTRVRTPGRLRDGTAVPYAWGVRLEDGLLHHAGAHAGFRSAFARRLLDGVAAVVLGCSPWVPVTAAREILELLDGDVTPQPANPSRAVLPVGRWQVPAAPVVAVVTADGGLVLGDQRVDLVADPDAWRASPELALGPGPSILDGQDSVALVPLERAVDLDRWTGDFASADLAATWRIQRQDDRLLLTAGEAEAFEVHALDGQLVLRPGDVVVGSGDPVQALTVPSLDNLELVRSPVRPTWSTRSLRTVALMHARDDVPGVVIAVRQPDALHVVSAGAIGPDTPFRTSSITKTVTSVVLHQLAGRGLIDLDAPVGPLSDALPAAAVLTPAQLLTHTAGLQDYATDPAWRDQVRADPDRVWSPHDLLAHAASLGPDLFAAGSGYAYSDTGYVLLGLLVEQVTGQPFAAVVRSHVIEPLGLTATWTEWHEQGPADATTFVDDVAMPAVTSADCFAAGGLISSASDLSRLFLAIGTGELGVAPGALLWTTTPSDSTYGPGLKRYDVAGIEAWGHAGFAGCFAVVIPALQTAVAMTLLQNAAVERGQHTVVLDAVLRAKEGTPWRAPQ